MNNVILFVGFDATTTGEGVAVFCFFFLFLSFSFFAFFRIASADGVFAWRRCINIDHYICNIVMNSARLVFATIIPLLCLGA